MSVNVDNIGPIPQNRWAHSKEKQECLEPVFKAILMVAWLQIKTTNNCEGLLNVKVVQHANF
jgi:hypothetical protein